MTSWKGYAASFMPELMAEYIRRSADIMGIDPKDETRSRFVEDLALEREMAARVKEHLYSRDTANA